ncbi:MAG TPA: MFS transporter [Actinomycetota bacterium]|nr:MFS transporter [Actinomycetota bacterium]
MSDTATTDPTQPAERTKRGSLWRHADFMKLWSAETVSQLGTQVTVLALPTIAIVLLKASAFEVGLLTTAEFLPFILVGLPAGVWVDRLRRRPILILGDLGRMLILGSIPIAYELHKLHIVQLYVCAFLAGICTVFFDVAYQSYLPSLVGREHLVEGNAKLEASRSGAQLAGPGLAGGLIQLVTAPVAIVADALSYLWSAAFVFTIRKHEPPVEPPAGGHPSMRSQIREGWRYVWRHPFLRPIAFCTANSNLWGAMFQAIFLLFAYRQLGMTPGQVGLVFVFGNVGFLGGALVASRIADRLGVGPTIVGSAVLFGIAVLPVPFASAATAFLYFVAALFFMGVGGVVYNINQVSLRQAITPERMQGRMNATMRFMVWGTLPIGGFLGGVLGNWIGIRPTLWVSVIGGLVSFVPPFLSPVRTLERIPEYREEGHSAEDLAGPDEGIVEPQHVPFAGD